MTKSWHCLRGRLAACVPTAKVYRLSTPIEMHARMKKPNAAAAREESPGLLTPSQFRSRCERGRFTQPMLLPRGFATPYTSPVRGAASLVIVVLLILASAPVDAAILKGVIFANEMNGAPIANVMVADLAQTTSPSVSDYLGRFTLEFRQRRAGDTVNIIVKKEGYLVVNEILLLQ